MHNKINGSNSEQSKQDVLVYIICHNDASELIANAITLSNVMTRVVRVSDTSPYFENQIFEKLELPEMQKEWIGKKYIGIITYTFMSKTNGSINFKEMLDTFQTDGPDVISLFNLDFVKPRVQRPVSYIESIAMQHGPFLWMAMYKTLILSNYKDHQIMDTNIKGFFSNWWLAKPKWMLKYIEFNKKARHICTANRTIAEYLKEDAYYTGAHVTGRDQLHLQETKLLKVFGKPFYTLHPFMFERLPCFFFHLEGANVHRFGNITKWSLLD